MNYGLKGNKKILVKEEVTNLTSDIIIIIFLDLTIIVKNIPLLIFPASLLSTGVVCGSPLEFVVGF